MELYIVKQSSVLKEKFFFFFLGGYIFSRLVEYYFLFYYCCLLLFLWRKYFLLLKKKKKPQRARNMFDWCESSNLLRSRNNIKNKNTVFPIFYLEAEYSRDPHKSFLFLFFLYCSLYIDVRETTCDIFPKEEDMGTHHIPCKARTEFRPFNSHLNSTRLSLRLLSGSNEKK